MVALSPLAAFCFLPAAIHTQGGRNAVFHPSLTPSHISARRLVITRSSSSPADILPTVREGVAEAGGADEWEKSVAVLSKAMEIDDGEEVERLLAEALGWRAWAAASEKFRKFQRPVVPDASKIDEAIAWLKDGPLQLDQEQLVTAIKTSPKVYLQGPDVAYRKAKGAAPRKFAEMFNELVLTDPSVMECYHNCADDGCASECGNCWVSYEMRS